MLNFTGNLLTDFLMICFVVVSIYLGLNQNKIGLGKQGLYAVIAFYIGEFLVFVFEFYLILSKRNKEKRTMTGGKDLIAGH